MGSLLSFTVNPYDSLGLRYGPLQGLSIVQLVYFKRFFYRWKVEEWLDDVVSELSKYTETNVPH